MNKNNYLREVKASWPEMDSLRSRCTLCTYNKFKYTFLKVMLPTQAGANSTFTLKQVYEKQTRVDISKTAQYWEML